MSLGQSKKRRNLVISVSRLRLTCSSQGHNRKIEGKTRDICLTQCWHISHDSCAFCIFPQHQGSGEFLQVPVQLANQQVKVPEDSREFRCS